MHEQQRLSDQERQTEEELCGLKPLRTELSAGGILVEVERRRGRRQIWAWRAIAACLGAGLAISMLMRSQPPVKNSDGQATPQLAVNQPAGHTPHQRIYTIPLAAQTSNPSKEDYLSKRDRIMVLGLSALSAPPPDVSPAPLPIERKRQSPNDESLLTFVKPLISGV
jgi:hypothetical protein